MNIETLSIVAEVAKSQNGSLVGGIHVELGTIPSKAGNYTHKFTCPGKVFSFPSRDVPKWLLPHNGEVVQSVTFEVSVVDSANGNWLNKQLKVLGVASVVDSDGKLHKPKLP